MEDDMLEALTYEVRQEVVENYFCERRLMEERIHYVEELAEHTSRLEEKLSRRFCRIYEVLQERRFIDRFAKMVGMETVLFDENFAASPNIHEGLREIQPRSLTRAGRYKKLLLESYSRLFSWNQIYRNAYEKLEERIAAVSANLKKFENNFDLLTILRFLRDMDVVGLERKHYLGSNFTPEEMNALDTTLRFKPVRIEQFGLIRPPALPEPDEVQKALNDLADRIYRECRREITKMMNGHGKISPVP